MSNNPKIYNIGIIGFGGMGGHHAWQLSHGNVRAKVKGIFDIRAERGKVAVEKGYIAYPSKEALLADPDIDIVLVSTPNDYHRPLCIEALEAGKHVMCEKPVTTNSADLRAIMAAAKKANRVFTIDQNRRVNRDFVQMYRAVNAGQLGKAYVIESRVEGSRGMPEGWRAEKKPGGGMMLDWGVHLIDQLLHFTDERVVNVFCKLYYIDRCEVDDNFRLTMTFESGLTAQVEVSTNNFITHPRWYVLGTEGTMTIDDWDGRGKIVSCLDKENKWDDDINLTKAGPSKTMAPRSDKSVKTVELSPVTDINDTVEPSWNQFIDAIEGTAPLKITPEQALRVIKVMEAAFKSGETGSAVKTNI